MEKIRQQPDQKEEQDVEEDDALQQRKVFALDGGEQKAANPRDGENDLDQEGGEEDEADLVEPCLGPSIERRSDAGAVEKLG